MLSKRLLQVVVKFQRQEAYRAVSDTVLTAWSIGVPAFTDRSRSIKHHPQFVHSPNSCLQSPVGFRYFSANASQPPVPQASTSPAVKDDDSDKLSDRYIISQLAGDCTKSDASQLHTHNMHQARTKCKPWTPFMYCHNVLD
jgi:hypothetical protein